MPKIRRRIILPYLAVPYAHPFIPPQTVYRTWPASVDGNSSNRLNGLDSLHPTRPTTRRTRLKVGRPSVGGARGRGRTAQGNVVVRRVGHWRPSDRGRKRRPRRDDTGRRMRDDRGGGRRSAAAKDERRSACVALLLLERSGRRGAPRAGPLINITWGEGGRRYFASLN